MPGAKQVVSFLAAVALLASSAARAQEARRVAVPSFAGAQETQPAPAAAAPAQPAAESVDLVGPTDRQAARAKAAAEAKARAEAEARARVEAEARARVEAELRAKALAEARLREEAEARARAEQQARLRAEAEARARAEAEEKARAEARARQELEARVQAQEAARAREQAEADTRARAAAEAQAKQAREEQARRDEQARLREQIEARVRAQVEAELRAREAKEQKIRARAEAAAKAREAKETRARLRAEAEARKKAEREEAKARKAAARAERLARLQEKKQALRGQTLPELPVGAGLSPVAVAPVPSDRAALSAQSMAVPAVARSTGESPARGTQVALSAQAPVLRPSAAVLPVETSPSRSSTVVPLDEEPRRDRRAEVRDELQVGPQSLLLNRLSAGAELAPGGLQGTLAYRLAVDDSTALHHLFLLGVESARAVEGEPQGARLWLQAGGSPNSSNRYGVMRSAGGQNKLMADQLGWSALLLAAGAGKDFRQSGGSLSLGATAQAESLSLQYVKNANTPSQSAITNASVVQIAVGAEGAATTGALTGTLLLKGFVYAGDGAGGLHGVPLRGALVEDDLFGLAAAPQQYEARLSGKLELTRTLSAGVGYTYLSYAQSDWSNAHLVHADVADRFGNLRASLGLTWQYDAPNVATPGSGLGDYSSLFVTGSLGYAF